LNSSRLLLRSRFRRRKIPAERVYESRAIEPFPKAAAHDGSLIARKTPHIHFSEVPMPACVWMQRSAVAAVLFLCPLGCARYKPKYYVPPSLIRTQYLSDVTNVNLLKNYNDMPQTTDAEKQAKVVRRNQILTELIGLIDDNYSSFEERYYGSDALVNFGGDVVNLGLTGVSSVTGSAHLKSVLSAIATGTTGIKTSYEKNFFDEQTRAAVVQQMRASRATQLAALQDQNHMKAPVVCPVAGCPTVGGSAVTPYSLETGLSDIQQYYEAGTIIGALQAIATSAGKAQDTAKTKQKENSGAQLIF
jgi:hypothetical protein